MQMSILGDSVQVQEGDIAVLRDGRWVYVTDAASSDPDDYRVFSIDAYEKDGSLVVKDELPVETIFMGDQLSDSFKYYHQNYDKYLIYVGDEGIPYDRHRGGRVVSDMSEVVSIVK